MALSVLILGSGSALPTVNTHQTAQIVRQENHLFLVDCGEGTQVELRRHGVKIQGIHHVFISHLHGDHFFGLVGLISTMHLLGRTTKLNVHGPKELKEIVLMQFSDAGERLSFELEFFTVEAPGQILYEDKKITISAIPLHHRIPCYGFLFQEKEGLRRLDKKALQQYAIPKHVRKSITEGEDFVLSNGEVIPNKAITHDPHRPQSYAFCSDTAYSTKLLDYIKQVDLLYHEATFMEKDKDRAKKTFHSTARSAAEIAQLAKVSKLLIGHASNRYRDKVALLKEAKSVFKDTSFAKEGEEYFVEKLNI